MLTGKQKAAMLLMSLDAATAAELLKGINPDEIQDVAIELAKIDASRRVNTKDQAKVAREFYKSLQEKQAPQFTMKGFLIIGGKCRTATIMLESLICSMFFLNLLYIAISN